MKKRFKKIVNWLKKQIVKVKPGKNAIRGASILLLIVTLILWILNSILISNEVNNGWLFLFALIIVLALVILAFISTWLIKVLHSIPRIFKLALFISIPLLSFIVISPIIILIVIVLLSLIGASILVLKKTSFKALTKVKKAIVLLGLIIGSTGVFLITTAYFSLGYDLEPIVNAAKLSESNIQHIKQESPAKKGSYAIKELTYGSGKDRHRPEYGANVSIKTEPVNGIGFIDGWDGFSGWSREKYWDFDSKSLPINGRVWYPEGDGPFPLVLVVHGNHAMQDYSDLGYDYLGKLLASRGIILASVDQNFINTTWTDIFGGLDEENDARAWLLLEHLKVWHQWNDDKNNEFYKKIDTSKLALIGHSRGGEAVAHATMFNKLPHYPDDASITFDYNFNIKSIIAIAPVDGQYESGERSTKIENINYFVIHGSQDADVRSFMGSQQYERITFKDSLYYFKTGLYVNGANHGQFNSTWGKNDITVGFEGLLNLKQLLSEEEQRQIAEVYISAFLETTLRNKKEYLPLFIDARKGRNWLPETIYLNQFEDSSCNFVCSFEEDFNVASTTKSGGNISSKNLSIWREEEINLKWEKKGSRALVLGWDYDFDDKKEENTVIPEADIASYSIEIESNKIAIDSTSAFVFSMAESTESSNPKAEGKWIDNEDANNNEGNKSEEIKSDNSDDKTGDEPKEPIDLTIQLEDINGQSVKFLLSDFSALQRQIESVIWKIDFLTDDSESEKVFQTFYFPNSNFKNINSNFDNSNIRKINFIFDRSKKGVIVIDNIGFMKTL